MNNRQIGAMLMRKEVDAWKALPGAVVQPPILAYRWVGGRGIPLHIDFFGRYDIMVAFPEWHVLVLIQVSTEAEYSHADPGPMGFCNVGDGVGRIVEDLMGHPEEFRHGIYEVYAYWRKLGKRGKWMPDRRWWRRDEKEVGR